MRPGSDPGEQALYTRDITDEMRSIMADRIKATGKKYPELAKITSVNESALKNLVNPKNPAMSLSWKVCRVIMSL